MQVAKILRAVDTFLLVGDELIRPGLPQHKMRYVGPIGPYGEDVVDPAKASAAMFVRFESIPDKEQLLVGERGTADWTEILEIQKRARDVVARRVVNQWTGPNCEHIGSYIRHGEPDSPQLKFWGGAAAVALIILGFKSFGGAR